MELHEALARASHAIPKVPVTVFADRVIAQGMVSKIEISTVAAVTVPVVLPPEAIAAMKEMKEAKLAFNGERLYVSGPTGRASFRYATSVESIAFTAEMPVTMTFDKGGAARLAELATIANPHELVSAFKRGVTLIADGMIVYAMATNGHYMRVEPVGTTCQHGSVTLTPMAAKNIASGFSDAPRLSFGERGFVVNDGDAVLHGLVIACDASHLKKFAGGYRVTQPAVELSAEQVKELDQALAVVAISNDTVTLAADIDGIAVHAISAIGSAKIRVPCTATPFRMAVAISMMRDALAVTTNGAVLQVMRATASCLVVSPAVGSPRLVIVAPLDESRIVEVSDET